jgi:hypothetical protein
MKWILDSFSAVSLHLRRLWCKLYMGPFMKFA